jgi:5-methylcytosine-specific restriction endonuclease McrA
MKTYEHRLLCKEPHPQSLASLILLTRHYLVLTRSHWHYRTWLIYRKQLLKRWLKEFGELACHYCKKGDLKINTRNEEKIATLDHVVPRAKGGTVYDSKNLVVACLACNQSKKDKMPV